MIMTESIPYQLPIPDLKVLFVVLKGYPKPLDIEYHLYRFI